MARPRSKENRTLPEGLYPPSEDGRSFRIRHPLTGKFKSLKTMDEAKAKKLHALLYPRLLEEKLRAEAEELQRQIEVLGGVIAGTLADLAREMLPTIPMLTAKDGKPLSDHVKQITRLVLSEVIQRDIGKIPIKTFGDVDEGPRLVRQFLAETMDHPSWYNQKKGVLSRLFKLAIDKGHIVRNPCSSIASLYVPKRDVYVPDEAFVAITEKLITEWHEVYAYCCDLIYLMCARVGDALKMPESGITVFPEPMTDAEGKVWVGRLLYQADKNSVWVDMLFNQDMLDVIEWFRAYKRREGIISPLLCVHPIKRTPPAVLTAEEAKGMTDTAIAEALGISNVAWAKRVKKYGIAEALSMGKGSYACSRRLAGKPITVAQLRDRFDGAKEKAGIAEQYTLRDFRPKGLTDEAMIEGKATNKGGWKEGSDMPQRYVKLPVPVRTRNNLRMLRGK